MTEPITGRTQLIGLLGSPVSHSISPMMHNEAFRLLQLPYAYLAFDVDTGSLKAAVDGLKTLNARGFNLTMPDKTLICEYVDHLSPAARLTGSVNTVVNDNGILNGYTTDGTGYMMAAQDAGYQLKGTCVTLLGGGGAAASICAQAALDGVRELHIFNRKGLSYARMSLLCGNINRTTDCRAYSYELADTTALKNCMEKSAFLINATSVGMSPEEDQCPLANTEFLHPDLVVSDVIYNPRETLLMRLAKERGCSCFNGMYMLLYQGAEAFRLWTGREMPVQAIKERFFRG